ncbi:MAG: aminotransferase class I/II-fold pyridoxal phosphate-dependent enzyme [Chloroflexi bacterium]|nr:aminotransferase class I/II-fold pyridoxal phosphate-dependent enzyme [Chloroflexota bacterium]
MTPSSRNQPKTARDPLARRVRQVPPSGIRKFFDLISSMEGAISLGVGEPDFATPWHIREQAIRAIEQGYTHYTSNYGLPELRRELARHLNDRYGLDYDPKSELLITVGVSEGLDLSMRAILDPGDEVIVPEPTYVSYLPCVTLAGGVPVPVPTTIENDFRVRASDIEARVSPRTKAIILCYPNNPTGAVMEHDEMAAIAEVARRHDLIVVSDEVYARLVYGGHDHVCFAALPGMQERTIRLGGVSKAYAMTGWRIGYAAARGEVLEGMMKIHQYTIMSAPTMGQYAAIEALRTSEADVVDMLWEYDRRRRLIVAGLNKIGMTCFEPRGAFYAFPSIKSTSLTSEEFSLKLLTEEKVAVVPGSAFGQAGEGYVRCCYAVATPQIEEALARMGRFMDRHRRT